MPGLTRKAFLTYIDAFNTRNYSLQHSFYAADVTLRLPDPLVAPLHGPGAIAAHYAQVHSVAEETVVPMVVLMEGDKVFFVMEVYFRYTVDTDEGVHGRKGVKKGDVFKVEVWALYDVDEEGKMSGIRCVLADERMLGQVDVEGLVRESRGRAQEDLR